MSEVQILETPIKSEGDKKSYRLIKLTNGLKALLIRKNEDEENESKSNVNGEDIAAAQLSVNVGSFDDPPNAMGLAHFLEHMVCKCYFDQSKHDYIIYVTGSYGK